jgi:5-methylcytosine-specific restriction endonuclease McrA
LRARIKPITESKRELRVVIDKDLEAMIERIKDLESQRTKKPATLEDTLLAMAKFFLDKKDPIEKAKRITRKNEAKIQNQRNPEQIQAPKFSAQRKIPEAILRQVRLRDQGKCQAARCHETKWIEVHHLTPWSHGGGHELKNLLTLCSFHHRRIHKQGELKLLQ